MFGDEDMNEMTENRKHFSKLGLLFLTGLLFTDVLAYAVGKILKVTHPEWIADPNINMLLANSLQYLIGMPFLIFLVERIPGQRLQQKKMKTGHFFIALLMCMAVAYASNIAGNIITTMIGIAKGSMVENVNLLIGSETNLFLNFIIIAVCAPFYEEYIFRKLIVDRTVRYGQGVAVVMSGLMFGLAHGNLNQFAFAFTIGMFFAFIYVKTGKLRYSIAMHMFFNFYSGVVLMGVMRHMHFDEYMKAALEGNVQAAMQVMTDAAPAWGLFTILVGLAFSAGLAGLILLIVFWKRFKLERGNETLIPNGKRFVTIFCNVGMAMYCLYFITSIVLQLFGLRIF